MLVPKRSGGAKSCPDQSGRQKGRAGEWARWVGQGRSLAGFPASVLSASCPCIYFFSPISLAMVGSTASAQMA